MSFFGITFPGGNEKEKSPDVQSKASKDSASSYRINTEDGGEREMTQDEVNRLVHHALRRARKATTPGRKGVTSPSSDISSVNSRSSNPSASSHPYIISKSLKTSSVDSQHMHELLSPTMDSLGASVKSTNSADSVLRKVEEEIQNAKRAALESSQRLRELSIDTNLELEAEQEVNLSPTQELEQILDVEDDDEDMHDILDVSDDNEEVADQEFLPEGETKVTPVKVNPSTAMNDETPVKNNTSRPKPAPESPRQAPPSPPSVKLSHSAEPSAKDVAERDDHEKESDETKADTHPQTDKQEKRPPRPEKAPASPARSQASFVGEEGIEAVDIPYEKLFVDELNERPMDEHEGSAQEEAVSGQESPRPIPPSESEYTEVTVSSHEGRLVGAMQSNASEYTEETIEEVDEESEREEEVTEQKGESTEVDHDQVDKMNAETSIHRVTEAVEQTTIDADGPEDESFSPVLEVPESERLIVHDDVQVEEGSRMEGTIMEDEPATASEVEKSTITYMTAVEVPMDEEKNPWLSDVEPLESEGEPVPGKENDSRQDDEQPQVKPKQPEEMNSTEKSRIEFQSTRPLNVTPGKVQFRHPYPYPPPLPKPRPKKQIIEDNSMGIPKEFDKWSKARPDLEKLLLAARGDSLHRRGNACGALKVLSQQKRNQLALVRTKGFLDAIVFAIEAPIPNNIQDRDLALDSRGRAVSTLLNVSKPTENRTIVMVHPGVGKSLLKVVEEDQGEARVQACAALAMLAKTAANREFMAKTSRLLDVLGHVLLGSIEESDDQDKEDKEQIETSFEEDEEKKEEHSDVEDDEGDDEFTSGGGFGSNSFSSMDDDETPFDEGDTSFGHSSSMSSIHQPSRKDNRKDKSIRRQKDALHDQYLRRARVNACAALMHLTKHCAISDRVAENEVVVRSLVQVSREFDNEIHTRCLEMLCNLTRFPPNNSNLARNNALVETLIKAGKSKLLEDRVWSMRSIQNLSSDSTSKVILANSRILTLLSICAMRKDHEEQAAAVAALYNLSTEPGAVVPLTNTRNVVATLVHLAHNAVSATDVRAMACDALATIGLWLQTLAGSGTLPSGVNQALLPTHRTTGWQRWDK